MKPPPQVPTFDALMWPTLTALKTMGGSASNEELLNKIIEQEAIPEEVAAIIHTDHRQSKLSYNLAWAKTYLKRVGAIDNSTRGVWSITDTGQQMSKSDVAQVPAIVRRQDNERRKSKGGQDDGEVPSDAAAPDESLAEAAWKDRLLNIVRQIPPDAFERLGACLSIWEI